MPPVLKNLLGSEKAVVSIALIVACTALSFLGKLSFDQWKEFVTWIAGFYLGTKGLQGAAAAFNGKAASPSLNDTELLPPTPSEQPVPKAEL